MQITSGQQYNVGEKPTAILYIYIVTLLECCVNHMTTKKGGNLDPQLGTIRCKVRFLKSGISNQMPALIPPRPSGQQAITAWINMDPRMLQVVFFPILIFASAFNAQFHILERRLGQVRVVRRLPYPLYLLNLSSSIRGFHS